jgi:hypothetical protein
MESLLDDLRRDEWRRANEIFDDPFNIDIQDPEEEYIELSSTDPIIEVNPKNYFLDIQ